MHKKLLPAYLLVLVNILGFSLMLPVLPFIVEDYGAPKYVYGFLLSSYSLFQFLAAPYLGKLSDSKGRKPVLLISQAGTLMCWFVFVLAYFMPEKSIFGFALPLYIIALARVVDGITGGNNSVTQAYVADITSREEKSYVFGYLGGIVGLGLIIGPGVGGFLSSGSIGYLGTVLCALVISLVTLISIYVGLDESLPEDKRSKFEKQPISQSFRLMYRIKKLNPPPIIRKIFAVRGCFTITMATYISTIALFMIDVFQFDERELGFFMLFVGFFVSFNQVVLSKKFISWFGEYRTMRIGLFLCTVGLICITLTENLWLYIPLYYILNLGISLCIPTFNSILAQTSRPQQVGEVMGISESIISLSNAFIPIIATMVYTWIGSQIYWYTAVLPLIGLWISKGETMTITDVPEGVLEEK
jgi:MFS transporter, DHA1 family, tetracycline resistance protein